MIPTLAVVFDYGSVSPMELILASDSFCELLFVCGQSSSYVAQSLPLLQGTGTVLWREDPDLTAAALRKAGVSGIVTFGDAELSFTAALAGRLGLPFHTPQTVSLLTDKQRQRARLSERGVSSIRHAPIRDHSEIGDAIARVGVPAVLKPRQSAASRNTWLVRSESELMEAIDHCFAGGDRSLILEECLVGDPSIAGEQWGDYVSVESLVVGGRISNIGVTGKPPLAQPFRETGSFFPSTLPGGAEKEALAVTSEALTALGIHEGMCHTELKLTSEGPKVIEVNGRLGGFVNDVYFRSAGLSLLRLTMAAALGQPAGDGPLPECVAYQVWLAPPTWARSVRRVSGVDEARSVPGVRRVDVTRGPGASVDWRKGTSSSVVTVYGDAPDHAAFERTRTALGRILDVEYAP